MSTLDIHSYGRDTPEIRAAVDNLRRFHAAGGTVNYGTDLGNGPRPRPASTRREVLLLRDAGLELEEILHAMVRAPLDLDVPAYLDRARPEPARRPQPRSTTSVLVVRAGRVVATA